MATACAALDARLCTCPPTTCSTARRAGRIAPATSRRPINTYGASKLAGERRIRETAGLRYLVIRSSWIYSQFARNSFFALLERARPGEPLRIVDDQTGSPTSAWSLADAIWRASRLPTAPASCISTTAAA
jgi:dTDP-4-dehydrorhamnose reductase